MQPGKRLDERIAKEVMQFKTIKRLPPMYSKDMECAWLVVEQMYERGYGYCIERAHSAPCWTVHFMPANPKNTGNFAFVKHVEDMERISDSASSLPHAICLAALHVIKECGE